MGTAARLEAPPTTPPAERHGQIWAYPLPMTRVAGVGTSSGAGEQATFAVAHDLPPVIAHSRILREIH